MIKIENVDVVGWEHAIRGMRNPMNSWDKSDSICSDENFSVKNGCLMGKNDHELMMKLSKAGTDHRKFMRMIVVYADITAPLYWFKEYDTYKVGTVANSCSTMHKIHDKEFTLDDFSHEHLIDNHRDIGIEDEEGCFLLSPMYVLENYIIEMLNVCRDKYLETKDKKYWWQMIQLLPSSYNQRRTVMLNYEVLAKMYHARKTHKLDEWQNFCEWIENELPYSELIIQNKVHLSE